LLSTLALSRRLSLHGTVQVPLQSVNDMPL
jgi:hypothetical protein